MVLGEKHGTNYLPYTLILVYGKQFIYESVMICNGNYVLE